MDTPLPNCVQRHWMSLESGILLRCGRLREAARDPARLDTDQWCRAARAAGQQLVVQACRDDDGLCHWPTGLTHGLAASRKGRDVLGSLVNSCRRFGLEVGIRYSLAGCHDTGGSASTDLAMGQLSELSQGYGPFAEVWLDAACEAAVPPVSHWGQLYAHLKGLEPNAVVIGSTPPGLVGMPLWPCDARSVDEAASAAPLDRACAVEGKRVFLPLQVTADLPSAEPGRSPRNRIAAARSRADVLLLGCDVAACGTLRPDDVSLLTTLGQ